MVTVLDGIENAIYDDEPDEMRPEFRADVIADLARDAIQAIRAIDDHCDGIDASRKSQAMRRVRMLEAFALTLAEA